MDKAEVALQILISDKIYDHDPLFLAAKAFLLQGFEVPNSKMPKVIPGAVLYNNEELDEDLASLVETLMFEGTTRKIKVIFTAPTYRQVMTHLNLINAKTTDKPIFKKGTMQSSITFPNGTEFLAIPVGTQLRGHRADVLIVEDKSKIDPTVWQSFIVPILNNK